MTLGTFIAMHRQQIIERARAKVAGRAVPPVTPEELANGIPLFLTQLGTILDSAQHDGAMETSASLHGGDLLQHGFSIGQVVHDYGDVCQVVTELATDLRIPISTEDFHTLNKCLDDAIAHAVTEYARQRAVDVTGAEIRRKGFFAHELRNHLQTATLAFQMVKSGRVGVTGSTVGVLERSLRGLRDLIDRSVSEVRLTAGVYRKQRIRVAEFMEEAEIHASMEAVERGLQFHIEGVDSEVTIDVDRQLFASAISNLLQNAFKFTRHSGLVSLRARTEGEFLWIEIEDECGGLPAGATDALFRPFEQRGVDRAGLGLGLAISKQAIETDGGTISVRDIPGKGCVFTVKMPLSVGQLSLTA